MESSFHPAMPGSCLGVPDVPVDLRKEYESMLGRLCRLTGVPAMDEPRMLEGQALELSGVPIAFRLEPWSGFVRIYADVGQPAPTCADDVYRTVLQQHLCLPAPFQMIVGLDGETGHLMLHACAPLSRTSETDDHLLKLLETCVAGALLLRNGWSSGAH